MAIFYVPGFLSDQVLPEEESQHAVKVLRLTSGSAIEVVDGAGNCYRAKITIAHPKHCSFVLLEPLNGFGKHDYFLHIAIAPTKNIDRFEWFVEKATEIGVDEITPLVCQHSERKILKPERIEKIIVSAAKQSMKSHFPKLNPLKNLNELLKADNSCQKYIAHCYDTDKHLLSSLYQKREAALILIGPEGDFSPEEVAESLSLGFKAVSLGNSRLRTETAGIAACHTISLLNQINN